MIQQNVSAVKNQAIHFIDKINVMVDYNETFEQHFQIKKSVTKLEQHFFKLIKMQ